MRIFIKKVLALLTVIAVTMTCGALPVLASADAEPEQTATGIVANEFATSGVTSLETAVEEGNEEESEEIELTFEVKDPYDLDDMQRISTYTQRTFNASGFTGEGSYLYGDQLPKSSAAKMVYDALKDAWLGVNPADIDHQVIIDLGDKKIPMRTTVNGVYNNSGYWDKQSADNFELATQCAIDAFLYDFPDIFWMKFGTGGMSYSAEYQASGDGENFYVISVTVNASLIDNASGYCTAVDNKINALATQFANGGANSFTKIKNAHDYIATHIEYGYTSIFGTPHTRTPYGALFGDYIVCEGYARTFKLFCERFKIPCVLVVGYAEPQHELHMWNAVKLDGNWYLMDVTWDDAGGSNGVVNTYFLAGLDTVVSAIPGYTTPRSSRVSDGIFNSRAFVFTYPAINSVAYSTSAAPTYPSNPSGSSSGGSGGGGSSGGGGGGGSGSSGGGSGGGGSTGTITGTVLNKTMDVTSATAYAAVNDAIKAAKASGVSTANVRFKNPGKITIEVIKEIVKTAGMPLKLTAELMSDDGKAVNIRISLDPSKVTADIDLAASISDKQAMKMNTNFAKWFKNAVQSVNLAKNSFGQEVDFSVKLDSKMDKTNLKFYSYDGKACSLLPNQKYSVTKSGYVKFSADPAGDIIISVGDLVAANR